jgi:hypothetical protein
MIVEIREISLSSDSPTQTEYRVVMMVDGLQKSFMFSAIKSPVQGINWETQFTEEILRRHRRIAHQIMTLVDLFHDGESVALPKRYSD